MATPKVAVYSRNANSRGEVPRYYLSRREAEELLASKQARNVSSNRDKLTHIQLIALQRDERPSPTSITFAEMNSGYWEGIRGTERVADKIAAWPTCVDTLAPCVRPRV